MTKQDLTELYALDPEFVAEYHGQSGLSIEDCVNDTWEAIKDHEIYIFDFGYFSIDRAGDIVPKLGGFFIKPGYRTKEHKARFCKELYERMPNIFLGNINNKSKALSFLKNMPGSEIVTTTSEYTYFCFRKENFLCRGWQQPQ